MLKWGKYVENGENILKMGKCVKMGKICWNGEIMLKWGKYVEMGKNILKWGKDVEIGKIC